MIQHTPTHIANALSALWGPGGFHSLCCQRPGHPFNVVGFFDDVDEMIERALQLPTENNIWWGVHPMTKPAQGRGGADDVLSVSHLAADFDWSHPDAHKHAELPSEDEIRAAVAAFDIEPTIIVESGYGLQCYWAFTEPIEPTEATRLYRTFFDSIEDVYGLSNDRKDLASILRVPGTLNNKIVDDPQPVRLHVSDVAWDPTWLIAEFPETA